MVTYQRGWVGCSSLNTMATIHIIKVVAETDEDLAKFLNELKGTVIQCENSLPGNRFNREFVVYYSK